MSVVGCSCSILGILGVVLSNALAEVLLFVITAMSGLFTLGLLGQQKEN
ncbi:hypothetical protein MBGDC06_00476 [Thermoplasmatales archaeon SCGC AB-539-C06]|nr:hypothetical protein MBGDC06_00476 [Thermoplasmatales archaeon SCGC AB-539-C06]